MDVPVVCQRQEPIITTAQKTVEFPQVQSDDQCRRITSCSTDYAVRVLMRVRRAWRLQPMDECSWTVSQTPLIQRVQILTEVPQIQFIDESRRHRGQQTQRDVCTQGREPTRQGGVSLQAKPVASRRSTGRSSLPQL